MNQRRQAVILAILCVLFWGFSFISIKIAVEVFPPMTLGALRFAIAVIFLFFIKQKLAPHEKINRDDLLLLTGAGLSGVTMYFFFENTGVSLVKASEASIITASIPVITMFAEWLGLLVQKARSGNRQTPRPGISPRRLLGAAASMAGVWLVVGISFSLSGSILGYIYMLGSAISWVIYCFLTRPLFARHSQIFIVFWQSVFGFLGFVPFAILEIPRWGRATLPVTAHVVFLAICCSALGYWFYARALKILGIGAASVFINMVPVVTAAAGFFFLGERLHILQWLGAALVVSGVCLALRDAQ